MTSSRATGTDRNRGGRPSSANRASPCWRGVIASPGPPIGRMRFQRRFVLQAASDVVGQIVVADGLAGRQRPVAEDQERAASPHALDLARQRLEEGGRPHDGIAQAGLDQRRLEGQLGLLKGEERLLHADGGEQHEVTRRRPAAAATSALQVGAMVDRPGVPGRAGARGHAGHHGVEPLIRKPVAGQRVRIGGIHDLDRRADEQPGTVRRAERTANAGAGPHETDHLMSTPQQGADGRAADRAGGSKDTDALACRGARSLVPRRRGIGARETPFRPRRVIFLHEVPHRLGRPSAIWRSAGFYDCPSIGNKAAR